MSYFPKALAVAASAVLFAACGGGGGGGGPGGPTETILFEDAFDGAFPGASWSVSGPASIDTSAGAPAPALQLGDAVTGGDGGRASYTGSPFVASAGFTLYCFVGSATGGTEGGAAIYITDANTGGPFTRPTVQASAGLVRRTTQPGLDVVYHVVRANGAPAQFGETLPDDGTLHDIVFRVTTDGRGAWYRNGVQKLSTGTDGLRTGSGEMRFELEGGMFTGLGGHMPPYAAGVFDEVLVTRP